MPAQQTTTTRRLCRYCAGVPVEGQRCRITAGRCRPEAIDHETRRYLIAAAALQPLDAYTVEGLGLDPTGRFSGGPVTEADRVVELVIRAQGLTLADFLADPGGWLAYIDATDDEAAALVAIRRIETVWWVAELLNPTPAHAVAA